MFVVVWCEQLLKDVRAAFVTAHAKHASKLTELEDSLKKAPKSMHEGIREDIKQEVTPTQHTIRVTAPPPQPLTIFACALSRN